MTDQTTPVIIEQTSTVPVEATVSRLLCTVCSVDIGEKRKGKSGRQQTMCQQCKKDKKKKHEQAWNFFRYGQSLPPRKKRKSC